MAAPINDADTIRDADADRDDADRDADTTGRCSDNPGHKPMGRH